MSRLVLGTVAAVLVGVGVAAQQEMLPRPGPGSGGSVPGASSLVPRPSCLGRGR